MKTSMSLLIIFAFCTTLFAQQSADSTKMAPFSVHSFQFTVNGLFNLSNFNGATISYKRQKSQSRAWRVGLTISGRVAATDNNDSITGSEASSSGFDEMEQRVGFGLDLEYLRYYKPADEIWLFTAIGTQLGFDHNSNKQDNYRWSDPNVPHSYYKEYTSSGFSVGAMAGLGVEWFFRAQMSLHAEYGMAVLVGYNYRIRDKVYVNYENSGDRHVINKDHTYSVGLYNRFSRLGLSIYF